MRQYERDTLPGVHRELGDGGQVLAAQLHGGVQPEGVRPGGRSQVRPAAPDPGHQVAVVEPQPQVHAHGHAARQALDDAHHVRRVAAQRHAVHHSHLALVGVPVALQDQGVVAVAAVGGRAAGRGSQQPPSGLLVVQEGGEAGGGVEAGQAEPVDGAVAADQGGGVQITQ